MSSIIRDASWSDVCALPSGGFAHVVAERGAVAAYAGANGAAPIWRQTVATDFLRFLRCAAAGNDEIRAIGQGGDGQAWFVGPGIAEPLGPTHGVNPVAIRHDGRHWIAYVVTRPDGYRMIRIDGDAEDMLMPWSSQGIRDVLPDGTVVLGDNTYAGTFDGYGFGEFQRRDGVIAGQHGFSVGVLMEAQHHFFKARAGQTNFGVHLARAANRLAVCALTESGAWFAEFTPPFPPHEPLPSGGGPAIPPTGPPPSAPEQPAVTISSYSPTAGEAPLTVKATGAVTGGMVSTFTWRWRRSGEGNWHVDAAVPSTNLVHEYKFAVAGSYEISLRGDGPGGIAETGLRRGVTVAAKPEPAPHHPPVVIPVDRTVTFRTRHGRFLCADLDAPDVRLVGDRAVAGAWEHFTVEPAGGERIRLRAANRKYVTAEEGGGRELVANRDTPPGAWEHFDIVISDAGIALRTSGGKFVRVDTDGTVRADGTGVGPEETFTTSAPLLMMHAIGTIAGRLRLDGRFFVNDAGTFRPVFTSALSILRRSDEDVLTFLQWAARTGFNGIRVFAGALKWANQTANGARDRLPFLLTEAAKRGLYVEVTAITDSLEGNYDPDEHFRTVARICDVDNAILEVANEPYHSTQASRIHEAAHLLSLGGASRVPFALGAAESDESDEMFGGSFITAHLDRGRDKWNQVRRVRELEMLSDKGRKPVLNNEPIGAAEASLHGRRESDPAFFFCLGVLNRIFEVGGVFHSDAGLNALLPGPVQQACAEAFVAGSRTIPVEDRLRFQNAGWDTSPVASARFEQTIVRAYSGVSASRAWTALVGLSGDPGLQLKNGWGVAGEIAKHPGITVLQLKR